MDIILKDICKSFGGRKVLDGVSCRFEEGSVSCIMGPSGCGKTTLLNILAGLVAPDAGCVSGTAGRRMAYAFQEPRLVPWKNVSGNVALAVPGKDGETQARRFLEIVGLSDSAEELPANLSGGMAQRVSLARALAADAGILLLDEPFSAIDPALKEEIMGRLKVIFRESGMTVIMVTHSPEEADFFGSAIVNLG